MSSVAVSDEPVENFEPTYDITKDHPRAAAIWIKAQADKGYLPATRVRPVVSSLNSILKLDILEPEEKTVAGFVSKLDDILYVRWRNKQKATSKETADTYKTRILWLMEEYKYRCENAASYNHTERFKKYNDNFQKKDAKKDSVKKKESAPHLSLVPDPLPTPSPSTSESEVPEPSLNVSNVPMVLQIGGKQVTLLLPQGMALDLNTTMAICLAVLHHTEYSMADLSQFFGRLAAQANDFDWTKSVPDQIFKRA